MIQADRALNINLSQACDRGLAGTVAETLATHRLRDNRAANDTWWNAYVDRHGLPLVAFGPWPRCPNNYLILDDFIVGDILVLHAFYRSFPFDIEFPLRTRAAFLIPSPLS